MLLVVSLPVIGGILLINAIGSGISERMLDEFNLQQKIFVQQAAKRIQDKFARFRSDLAYLTSLPEIKGVTGPFRNKLEQFYAAKKGELSGITRVDRYGRILYSVPWQKRLAGRDISSQEHIKKLFKTAKPVVSRVFRTVQGYRAIAYHYPVYHNNRFDGSVGFLLPFKKLTDRFLRELAVGRQGYAWLLDSNGLELHCPVPGHTGRSVFKTCKNYPAIVAMAVKMTNGHSGQTVYNYDRIRGKKVVRLRKQAVYQKIQLDGNFWSVVMATPENEILDSVAGLRIKLILFGILFFCGAGIIGALWVKIEHRKQELEERETNNRILEARENRLRVILESIADGVVAVDCDGLVTTVNKAAERLLVSSESGLSGSKLSDVLRLRNSETGNWLNNPIESVLEEGEQLVLFEELELVPLSGSVKQVTVSAAPIVNENRKQSGAVVVIRDVSIECFHRLKKEESETKFRLLFENMPDGVVFFKPENGDYRIVRINPAAAQIEQVEASAVIGHRLTEVFPGVVDFGLFDIMNRVAQSGGAETFPIGYYRDERISGWRENYVFSLPAGEIAVIYRDATAQKRAEEALVVSLRQKESLLKEIHHRVKNNMQVISSLLYMQEERIRDSVDLLVFQETRSRIRMIAAVHENMYRAHSLTQLDAEVLLNTLIADIQQLDSMQNSLIRLELVMDEQPMELNITQAIPCALILHELLSNAYKFAFGEGISGVVTVVFKRKDESTAVLRVSDNGQGCAPGLLAEEPGTVGMQLVHALTGQLHGKLSVQCTAGVTVQIEFPLS